MYTKFIFLVFWFQSSTAVIRKLNDSDFARMPPLFHLDNYEECFDSPEAIYCSAEFSLVSDEPSELLTMIQEYSRYPLHYNYTLLRHGYCMHKTCKKFYNVSGGDLRWSLEACANESLYNNYKLKALVSNDTDCAKRDRELPIDNLDIAVAVICFVILLANLVASLCDRYLEKGRDSAGLRFLYCFSIFRNWKKFVATPRDSRDTRLKALKGINGMRALTMIIVVSAHALFISTPYIVNPEELEAIYDVKFVHIFTNGTLIMQIFLVISSFLLVYYWLIDSEKAEVSWIELPMRIIMRWLRLTPSYALALGLTVTWSGKVSTGPNYKRVIYDEISDCRREWWKHLLYINNYYGRSTCMPQSWYLAADTQLYFLGVILFLICRTGFSRKVVLSFLFVAGMIIPTLHIYYQGLHGAVVLSPEASLSFFMKDPTFHHVYIKGHTNLTGCIIGMALGYIIYSWQNAGGDPNKFRKYRYLYWSLFFWALLCTYSGSVYNYNEEPVPVYVEMLIGALVKPVFGIIMALIIAGLILQFEGLYRSILEWQPFTYLSRLTYSAYLLHFMFIKIETASINHTQRFFVLPTMMNGWLLVTYTFIAAFIFFLLVESPSGNLVGEILKKLKPHTKEDKETVGDFKRTEDDKTTDLSQTIIEDGAIVIKMGTIK